MPAELRRKSVVTPFGLNATFAIAGGLVLEASAQAQPQYRLDIAPLPPGMRELSGAAVNNLGWIVGPAVTSGPPLQVRGFIYDGASFTDLGELGGAGGGQGPTGINDAGDVVGVDLSTQRERGFLFRQGVRQALSFDITNQPIEFSAARAINNGGQIAGNHSFQCGPSAIPPHAARWAGATVPADLGSWLSFPNCVASYGLAINASGVVGGYGQRVVPPNAWDRPTIFSGGTLTDLGTFSGPAEHGKVLGLNDAGAAVGWAELRTAGNSRLDPCLWRNGSIIRLNASGPLSGAQGQARDINNRDAVVGQMFGGPGGAGQAFYWEGGVIRPLTDLIPPIPGAFLVDATGISETGVIVGTYLPSAGSFSRAFRLLPCDPGVAVQPTDASVGDRGSARFEVVAVGAPTLRYRWLRSGGVLSDGMLPSGASVHGAATAVMVIDRPHWADEGIYECQIITDCGTTVSAGAVLSVSCRADITADHVLDPDDLSDYIGCFFEVPACAQADFNDDGAIDPDDLSDYIGAFFQGC